MRGGALEAYIAEGLLPSMILWGPPGSGKTTIAGALCAAVGSRFVALSAVFSGVADLKKIFAEASQTRALRGEKTVLFVDEIHRFNKSQQDAFLHAVEEGDVILIGATTENPSFSLTNALLSRTKVFVLKPLSHADLDELAMRAEHTLGCTFLLAEDAKEFLYAFADGDARKFLGALESLYYAQSSAASGAQKPAAESADKNTAVPVTAEALRRIIGSAVHQYDKQGDGHYNLISALHKSLRGSDADAALYYFARMVCAGEDPAYIARRCLRMAYEDIGLADAEAASRVLDAWQTYERLGSPEGELAIAAAIIYLALAPKSNRAYEAYGRALASAKAHGSLMPPMHILNAPTKLMQAQGYGKGYAYDHDEADGFSGANFFPEAMEREQYYRPVERGFEREMLKRAEYFASLREKLRKEPRKDSSEKRSGE